MSQKHLDYTEYSEFFLKKELDRIENELSKKTTSLQKLVCLFRERDKIGSALFATAENLKTAIKENLANAYFNDKVEEYLTSTQHEKDVDDLKSTYNKKYDKFITLYLNQSPKQFMKDNSGMIPDELLEAFVISGSTRVSALPKDCVTGVCYGMLRLLSSIEDKIDLTINENKLTVEDLLDIESKYGGKIRWKGTTESLSKLFNMLFISNHVEFEKGSGLEKAKLIALHFHVGGRAKGSHASIRTIKTAFENTLDLAKEDSSAMKRVLR